MRKQIAWVDYEPPVYIVVFAPYFIGLLWQPIWSSYEPVLGRHCMSFDTPPPHPTPTPPPPPTPHDKNVIYPRPPYKKQSLFSI